MLVSALRFIGTALYRLWVHGLCFRYFIGFALIVFGNELHLLNEFLKTP